MTTRNRWDETRALIEAGWHSGWGNVSSKPVECPRTGHPCRYWDGKCPDCIDWIDTKQAQHDGSRQIYGDAGKFMRGGEPG